MAINSDIRDHAYQFFIEEAPELLQIIETGLLTLRQEKTTPKVHNLMRAAHSLKGGAASIGLAVIEAIAHRLETIFKALYGEIEIDTDLESQLLQAYDCLRLPLIEQITTGYFNPEQASIAAEPIFAQIEAGLGEALLRDDVYLPSSTELGVNMALSIFEVDVGQGLEHLVMVGANPQTYQVAGELRAQAEVFCGFAELLDQPQFGAIAQYCLAALDACPECAREILQLAIADFGRCRQAILAGAPMQEMNPASALVAFSQRDNLTNLEPRIPDLDFEASSSDQESPLLETIFGDVLTPTELTQSVEEFFAPTELTQNVEEFFTPTELTQSVEEFFTPAEPVETSAAFFDPTELVETSFTVDPAPATLELAIQSIEEIFNSFPLATELVSSPATPQAEPPAIEKELVLKNDSTPSSNLTVRVDSERLERMNNLVGELAINRNGLSLQNEQLQTTVKELLNRYEKVQQLVSQLQQRSDQMVVGTSHLSIAAHQSFESRQASNPYSQFDSLELDSYGALHSQLQELLEEMMQVEETVDDIKLFAKATDKTLAQQRQNMTQLRDELMWARMLPLSEVLNRFPRILRDLSTTYHKEVRLKLSRASVLVDKAILEKLYDPLLHLLRNAFAHGIEAPEVRREQGKPELGQIEIRAYHKGSQTIIEIQDDGQGLNFDRIRQRLLELEWLSVEQLANTSNARLTELIFEPGFSTASVVNELSGRGVGLDVVRLQLRSLKGTVTVTSSPGKGTTFILKLPLTLTIANLLICVVGTTALAFPADSIEEIVVPKLEQIQYSGTQRFLCWQEQIVPTYRLADLLNYACPVPQTNSKAQLGVATPKDWQKPMLVLRFGLQVFALEVERLVTEQELVIKPFSDAIDPPSFTYGCTILGDGSLIPVIDAAVLLEVAVGQSSTLNSVPENHRQANHQVGSIVTAKTPTILVVDDAVALRRTLALTLERAGFRVLQAQDGQEAIKQLQQNLVELVICDIEMPNMNGFEFLSARRQEPQAQIPIIMLTSRSNEKHRRLAMQLGASAYFTKPYIEQDFVQAIKELLKCSNN